MSAPFQPASRRRWGILGLLMVLCFISHFNRASITSAGDERIMQQFGISPERMGVVYSAFLMVYTAFMIPGGWFLDRFGPRVALVCMGLGSAAFCAITGCVGFGWVSAAQVWVSLLLVRSAMGFMTTPLHPGAAKAAGSWFGVDGSNLANGLITGASILAYAVVHPVFGALIDRVDWPVAFLITGSLTALVSALWWGVARDRPDTTEAMPEDPTPSVGPLLRGGLVWITLSYAAVGYFQYLFFYWLHYYFDSVVHLDKTTSRLYAGLPNLAMALCMPVGGWVTDQIRRRRGVGSVGWVPGVGMAVSSLLLLVALAAGSPKWAVVWFTASLGVLGLCEAAFWTVAVQMGGRRGGLSSAIMNTGGNGIGLLAPMLTPLVGERLGWNWGIGVGAAVGFLGALCWVRIRPDEDPNR